MSRHVRAQLVCAALCSLIPRVAPAGPLTIDLPTALARARERAPEAIAARGRIGQAEAGRTGAHVRFTRNPELDLGAGPRFGNPMSVEGRARIEQRLEPGRRGARIEVADAELRLAQALTDADLRELSFEVVNAFNEARYAELSVELADHGHDLAVRAAEAADRRRKAGEITDLDVDLAKVALGRARSAVATAQADRAAAIGKLAVRIGAGPDDVITLAGELRPAVITLAVLEAGIPAHSAVRALEAEVRVAGAERALANATGDPDLAVWGGYERDQGDDIVFAGLTITLPLWNRAQGAKAAASARQNRADAERAAVAAVASRQVIDAFEVYVRSREAVEVFERDVLPALVDGERLLERSVETGQIAVSSYLVARQEILAGRREHLDRQLALARAAAAARFVAGVSP